MNPVFLVLLAAVVASPVHAESKKKESGFQKVLRSMFPSATPKVVPRKRKRTQPAKHPEKSSVPQSVNHMYIPVDIDWMAKYWEQEASWDYYIPEDNLIRFVDGKYLVPIVVYRHYEAMAKTPRRTPPPKLINPVPIEG